MFDFIRRWKRYNRTANELYRLSDRDLADLGLTRSDIPRIARQESLKSPL